MLSVVQKTARFLVYLPQSDIDLSFISELRYDTSLPNV